MGAEQANAAADASRRRVLAAGDEDLQDEQQREVVEALPFGLGHDERRKEIVRKRTTNLERRSSLLDQSEEISNELAQGDHGPLLGVGIAAECAHPGLDP